MKIELTILGLLMEENLYGYEIKKKIVDRLEDYVDIKFGSIYYAIKKAVNNEWVKKVSTEKNTGNPERYIYEILPSGKKYYKKLLKQYFDRNDLHFDVDIIIMFLNFLSKEQKEIFTGKRIPIIEKKLKSIKNKIKEEKENNKKNSHYYILTNIEHHLKAELNWLTTIN
jgi:DNA-binding PadR family transcriptional regulator